VGPDGALWYCHQTGSIGRVYGPGETAVPPRVTGAPMLRLRVPPAVAKAESVVRAPGIYLAFLDLGARTLSRRGVLLR
jgi:hypothetical protein